MGRLPATQLGHGHLLSVLDSLTSVLEPLLCTKLLRRKKNLSAVLKILSAANDRNELIVAVLDVSIK